MIRSFLKKLFCVLTISSVLIVLVLVFLIYVEFFRFGSFGHPNDVRGDGARHADRMPQWSSDGDTIAVNIGGSIYAVSTDGGELWQIPEEGRGEYGEYSPSLSPDGRVAYSIYYRYDGGPLRALFGDDNGYYIETVDIDGTGVKRLTSVGRYNASSIPVWLPDGSGIAFKTDEYIRGDDVSRQVVRWETMAPDGSGRRILKSPGRFDRVSWANRSQRVAYATESEDGSAYTISTVRWDGTDEITVAEVDELGKNGWVSVPEWSHADDRIYFVTYQRVAGTLDYGSKLYSVASDGSDLRVVSDLGEGFDVHEVAVSPDGAELLFVNRDISQEGYYGVYLMNTDGADLRNLTGSYDFTNDIASHGGGGSAPYVSWSPDGSRIAVFYRNDHPIIDGRRLVLFTMARDGSDIRALITGIPPQLGHGELLQPAEDPAEAE